MISRMKFLGAEPGSLASAGLPAGALAPRSLVVDKAWLN
jgi:hypothetical protein